MKYFLLLFIVTLFIMNDCKGQGLNYKDNVTFINKVKEKYEVEADSVIHFSVTYDDNDYYALSIPITGTNLQFWSFCVQNQNNYDFYNWRDFISHIVNSFSLCVSGQAIDLISSSLIDKNYTWQCATMDSLSFNASYSRHGLACVLTNRKLGIISPNIIDLNTWKVAEIPELQTIIPQWQILTYGYVAPFEIYKDNENDAGIYIVKSHKDNCVAFDLLLTKSTTSFYSLEDAAGIFQDRESFGYPTETLNKIVEDIISLQISNQQKLSTIKSILSLIESLNTEETSRMNNP